MSRLLFASSGVSVSVSLALGWEVFRTPQGHERWAWFAKTPNGFTHGRAMSKAVAESRARRAIGVTP